MAKTGWEKQDIALGQFGKVSKMADLTANEPTFWEKQVEASKNSKTLQPARKEPVARISFYNPENPLNGIFNKKKAEQKEIAESLKHLNRKPRGNKETTEAKEDPSIKILKALYGIDGTEIDITGNVKTGKKVNNRLAGSDPVPGTKKRAIVTVLLADGTESTKTFNEGESIVF